MSTEPIRSHKDGKSYQKAFSAARKIFQLSKNFPKEEKYALTDQIRRSSRSVCANLAEAWRKRRYQAAFIAKLNDSEGEAAETQTWLDFAVQCGYMDAQTGEELSSVYEEILAILGQIINNSQPWLLKR